MRNSERVRVSSAAVTWASAELAAVSEEGSWPARKARPLCRKLSAPEVASIRRFSCFPLLPLPPFPLAFLPSFLLFLRKMWKSCFTLWAGASLSRLHPTGHRVAAGGEGTRAHLEIVWGSKWLSSRRPCLDLPQNRRLKYFPVCSFTLNPNTFSRSILVNLLDNVLFLPLQRSSFSKILLFSNSKFSLGDHTAHHWNRKDASSTCKEIVF